jgi:hypothetical protein
LFFIDADGLYVTVSAAACGSSDERGCGAAVPDVGGWRSFDTGLGIALMIGGLAGCL